MLRTYPVALLLLLASALAFPPAVARGGDPPAPSSSLLKEKGLTKSGRFFVLDGEKALLEKLKEVRGLLNDYIETSERKNEAQRTSDELALLEERRQELQATLDDLNQQAIEQGLQQGATGLNGGGRGGLPLTVTALTQRATLGQINAQRNAVRNDLNEVIATQRGIKSESPSAEKSLPGIDDQQKTDETKATLADLRKAVDELMSRYAELNADPAVKTAIRSQEKDKASIVKLGPSPAFKTAVKTLEKAERTILAKKPATASRKKGRAKK